MWTSFGPKKVSGLAKVSSSQGQRGDELQKCTGSSFRGIISVHVASAQVSFPVSRTAWE